MAYISRHALGATVTDSLAPVRAGSLLLKKGSKGDAVRALQTLIRQGQVVDGARDLLVVDGDFGPKTESFVRILQQALGVAVDGVVGKQTITALEAALGSTPKAAAAADFSARTPAKTLTKAEAIAKAKEAAKAKIAAKVSDMRQKGIADAKVGKYAAPTPIAPPDFDTMNYQAGWLSTGTALPPGVVHIGAGGKPVTDAAGGGEDAAGGGDNKMLITGGILAAAAVAAVFILRR